MVNSADKLMGIHERTSAEIGELPWAPGSEKQLGWLWAATVDGQRVAAFETAPGRVVLSMGRENLVSARKLSGVLNIVVEVRLRANDGSGEIFKVGVRGPKGRVTNVFAFLGIEI